MIPIPEGYDHERGQSSISKHGIPKKFFDAVPNYWFNGNLHITCQVHILHPEHDELW